jgi:uncharacterized membrane protein YobD (UPF0266 family)
MLSVGILDFVKPEVHVGAYMLTFVGVVTLFYYFMTYKDKPYMTTWKIIESDGSEHYEDSEMPGGATIKSLLLGLGLISISIITYFISWLRLTSLIFLAFGIWGVFVNIWVFYEVHFKKEVK